MHPQGELFLSKCTEYGKTCTPKFKYVINKKAPKGPFIIILFNYSYFFPFSASLLVFFTNRLFEGNNLSWFPDFIAIRLFSVYYDELGYDELGFVTLGAQRVLVKNTNTGSGSGLAQRV